MSGFRVACDPPSTDQPRQPLLAVAQWQRAEVLAAPEGYAGFPGCGNIFQESINSAQTGVNRYGTS
jgi:hypothetical protein